MAPSSPPRDEAADADPDVSRKRARLSEESSATESSAADAIQIEALAPETISADPASVIEIEDDRNPQPHGTMEAIMPFSESFELLPGMDAVQQLGLVRETVSSEAGLNHEVFSRIVQWLQRHLAIPMPEDAVKTLMYLEDDAFFGAFSQTALALLRCDGVFQPTHPGSNPYLAAEFEEFIINLMTLSVRMIELLPEIIEAKIKQSIRKDSKQGTMMPRSSCQCEIGILNYLRLTLVILNLQPHAKSTAYLREELGVHLKSVKGQCYGIIQRKASVVPSVVKAFQLTCWNTAAVKDAWLYLSLALRLTEALVLAQEAPLLNVKDLVGMVESVNDPILRQICEKHPRALPNGFHERVVNVCGEAVRRLGMSEDATKPASFERGYDIYANLIESDDDFLFVEGTRSPEVLATMCDGDAWMLSQLLRASWTLKAYRLFIFSSIMDIRSIGINQLSLQLGYWAAKNWTAQHPLLQYAARFLRAHEITKYIFSADSHANVVNYSEDIVGFLASTFNYTNKETDVIWQACMTSVEADFVKASFSVLQHVCRKLNFDHLLYVARKYTTAPASTLCANSVSVETFKMVLCYLHGAMDPEAGQEARLAPLMVCLDLLDRISEYGRTAATHLLYHIAIIEVASAITLPLEDRVQVYRRCVSQIREYAEHATSAVDVLAMFVRRGIPQIEGDRLLDLLPPGVAIEELGVFVSRLGWIERQADSQADLNEAQKMALSSRIQLIIGLFSLQQNSSSDLAARDALFDHLFGEHASDNEARNLAWVELARLANEIPSLAREASSLLESYLESRVSSMPVENVTPQLITLLVQPLSQLIKTASFPESPSCILDMPLWQTLVRVAGESRAVHTAHVAADALCHLLFSWPENFENKSAVVACQLAFVSSTVDRVCNVYADLSRLEDIAEAEKFSRVIELLERVYQTSKENAQRSQMPKEQPIIILDDATNDEDCMCFSAQLCSPESQRETQVIVVRATKCNTVADLASALQIHSDAAQNRIIVGGKVLYAEECGSMSLDQAGIHASSVIMVSPKFNFNCDLHKVLPCSTPVEHELFAQYDRLESFLLNGPPTIIARIYQFLRMLRPSATTRDRVLRSGTTAEELFPPSKPLVTAHSMAILSQHLKDYARLGVADADFILRGVHLLTDLMMDTTRLFSPWLSAELTKHLLPFLQEKPASDVLNGYFNDPAGFASRVLDFLSEATALPLHLPQGEQPGPWRPYLALNWYATAKQAFWLDPRVWKSFIENDRVMAVHAQLLLDEDGEMSYAIATAIELFCKEPTASEDHIGFYWQLAESLCLGQALHRRFYAGQCFSLANRLLGLNTVWQADEVSVRTLVQHLVAEISEYKHVESPEVPLADQCLVGLLDLLRSAITTLKAFKKPLNLGDLAIQLLSRQLFPAAGGLHKPLLSKESRGVTFELVKSVSESAADYQAIAETAVLAMRNEGHAPEATFTSHHGWIRDMKDCGGLTNLGMTCYMNSLLQQLYANLAFRKFIFDIPSTSPANFGILRQVQDLFVQMQESKESCVNTAPLVEALGIDPTNMDDVHSFYAEFLGKLEESMPDLETRKAFSDFYTGNFVSQIKGACGHISQSTAPFMDIPVTVKNKASLQDAMAEFVQGEPMQGANQYRCSTCDTQNGRLVDAMKRQCLSKVPDNLTFCLKRFSYDAMAYFNTKINDRFEFPQEIDMSVYKREHLEQPNDKIEPDPFELVGVIVHRGTVEAGHYWSYVRLAGSRKWVALEDQLFADWNVRNMEQMCFGGPGKERITNGYVLFYRRSRSISKEIELIKQPSPILSRVKEFPPKVEVSAELAQSAHENADHRYRIAHLFDPQFSAFMDWLIRTYPAAAGPRLQDSERDSVDSDAQIGTPDNISHTETIGEGEENDVSMAEPEEQATHAAVVSPSNSLDHLYSLGKAASRYFLHQVLRDLTGDPNKLRSSIQSIKFAEDRHGLAFVRYFLRAMLDDASFFIAIWTNSKAEHRDRGSQLVEAILDRLRQEDTKSYTHFLHDIFNQHSSGLQRLLDIYEQWEQYFGFVSRVSRWGPCETAIILDKGYLSTTLECILQSAKLAIDAKPLYDFIFAALDKHVDLSNAKMRSSEGSPHTVFAESVYLSKCEWELLISCFEYNRKRIWAVGRLGFEKYRLTVSTPYHEYAPGQILGKLASPKTDPSIQILMLDSLRAWYDDEEQYLAPMLYMTLHYCHSRGSDDATLTPLFKQLGENLACWDQQASTILRFFDDAIEIAPVATIESIPVWVGHFLSRTGPRARRMTVQWLEKVFVSSQLNALDASRTSAARRLVPQCLTLVQDAYRREYVRTPYNEVMQALELIAKWLGSLRQKMSEAGSEHLDQKLLIEYEESKSTLANVTRILNELENWVGGSMPFTITTATKESVEMEASDPEMEDDEDLSDEEFEDYELAS